MGDVIPVIFLHRIAESVSPPNLIHLAQTQKHIEPCLRSADIITVVLLYYI